MHTTRRRLICAGALPALAPAAAMAFRLEAPSPGEAAALATRCPSDGPLAAAELAALRQAHALHPLAADQRKMMEDGARCPVCGCPPALSGATGKGLL